MINPISAEVASGEGCVVMRAGGGCEFLMPDDPDISADLVLLESFALGISRRDQRLLDVLAVIAEEKRAAFESAMKELHKK